MKNLRDNTSNCPIRNINEDVTVKYRELREAVEQIKIRSVSCGGLYRWIKLRVFSFAQQRYRLYQCVSSLDVIRWFDQHTRRGWIRR
ncbi:MAG: hypothetical protein EZS28_009095 [Streblomastix strix]|uniref:Uncharacterized protein n=1 Tax=Streblomastix strix TaxID=222440 RepID=A0A5J4WK05_9EUKA|nr:MAG: hypothetical protein EZS28_009095 [Streblomastix strix]